MSNDRSWKDRTPGLFLGTWLGLLGVVVVLTVLIAACRPAIRTPGSGSAALLDTSFPPLDIGSTLLSPADGVTLLFVPAGEFRMGSEVGLIDEQPGHTLFLEAYWIDRSEVTNAMYNLCVQSGSCDQPSSTKYFADRSFADHPVAFVSWNDAAAYCSWADRRLPTEAEWEKAATWDPAAERSRTYPWGNDFDCSRGNFDDEIELDRFVVPGGPHCDGYERTSPVGSFPSGLSPYGVQDMAGNVWEWVADGFFETENYYAISPASNPKGPEGSAYRVLRGSSWNLNYGFARSAYRLWFGTHDSYDGMGFRCALSE